MNLRVVVRSLPPSPAGPVAPLHTTPPAYLAPVPVVPVQPPPLCDVDQQPPVSRIDVSTFTLVDRSRGMLAAVPAPPLQPPRMRGCVRSVMSESEASALFFELAHMTFVGSDGLVRAMPFTFPTDGCYARAHLMAQRIADRGFAVRKMFAEGSLDVPSGLADDAPVTQAGHVRWGYHVAPSVRVMDASGVVRTMVLDPSLANEPLTPQAWLARMGGRGRLTEANVNAFTVDDLWRTSVTPEGAEAAEASVLPMITAYADRAPAHELAAQVRRIFAERTPATCDDRVARARALIDQAPPSVRALFVQDYPMLNQLARCAP